MAKGDEVDLMDYILIIKKRWKFILFFVLIVLIITLNISFFWPKTYESSSVIQLGNIGGEIYSSAESKNLIESSIILSPVIEKIYAGNPTNVEQFRKSSLVVDTVSEKMGVVQIQPISYISIKTIANKPQQAKEINEAIIDQFFNYTLPEYETGLKLMTEDLKETEETISQLNLDIFKLNSNIDTLSSQQLSSEGISKATLLRNLVFDYTNKLISEKDEKFLIQESLNKKREFKIISYPYVPSERASPSIRFNLSVAFILGLLFSIIIVLIKEKKN